MLLGAHSLTEPEPHKRLYKVRAQFPHPGSNIHNNKDDLLLLQVGWRLMGPSSPPGTAPFLQIPLSLGGICRVTDWPEEILMARLGLVPLSIPPCPMGPSLLPPPKTFELCPNASTFLIAPALVSGCILGLQ